RKRLRNERRSPGRPGEKAEAANERDENEVPKRNNRSGAGRHQEGLKLQDNSDDGDEQVASPEVIERNLRDWISRHYAGAEAARKVIKASRLGNEARREIGLLIERLISKWKTVLSTLEAGRGKGRGGEGQARGTRALEECAGGGPSNYARGGATHDARGLHRAELVRQEPQADARGRSGNATGVSSLNFTLRGDQSTI